MNLAIMSLIAYLDIEVTDIKLTINSITDVKTKDPSGHNFQGFPIDNDIL